MIKDKNYTSKKSLFITATNTDVGKTYAASRFLKKYAALGYKVGYFKPFETGVESQPLDGSSMLTLTKELNKDFKVDINDVVPYQFKLPAAPFVANKNTKISAKSIVKQAEKLLQKCDILIVEGAGGLMVPIKKRYFMIDLIKKFQNHFNMKTILIVPSNLGSINDTLLSQSALERYGIQYDWYINLHKDKKEFKKTTLPFYKKYFNQIRYL